jgi:hypothetical protein
MRQGVAVSFSWLFSLIVGAVIIFLAVYASRSLVQTERQAQESGASVAFTNLFTPLRTGGSESFIPRAITFPQPALITLRCTPTGMGVRVRFQDSLAGESDAYQSVVRDSFISGNTTIQGKRVFSLVLPLRMPYLIGDVILLWSEPQCFVDAPEDMRSLFEMATNETITFANTLASCPRGSRKLCFAGASSPQRCDVRVDRIGQTITYENGTPKNYYDSLLAPALFSTPALYECMLEQMGKETARLAEQYRAKSVLIQSGTLQGCAGGMDTLLGSFVSRARAFNNSQGLPRFMEEVATLRSAHDTLLCPLWWNA